MKCVSIRKDDALPSDCLVESAALTAIVSRLVMTVMCPSLKTLPIHFAEESKHRGVLLMSMVQKN
jgi:hypothetical protein